MEKATTLIGNVPEPGDVILTRVKFIDSDDFKIRPALILFEESGNIVIGDITTNTRTSGISILKCEGAPQNSVIKLNYCLYFYKCCDNQNSISTISCKTELGL